MSKNLQGSQALGCDTEQEPASPRKGRNLQGKRRDKDNPYATYAHGGWEWRVLKHYQAPKGEAKNPNARVLCHVTSPYVPYGEMGDTYCREIPGYNRRRSMGSEDPAPSIDTMYKWMMEGYALATDGCRVEPDGTCPHGCESWLLVKGLI